MSIFENPKPQRTLASTCPILGIFVPLQEISLLFILAQPLNTDPASLIAEKSVMPPILKAVCNTVFRPNGIKGDNIGIVFFLRKVGVPAENMFYTQNK